MHNPSKRFKEDSANGTSRNGTLPYLPWFDWRLDLNSQRGKPHEEHRLYVIGPPVFGRSAVERFTKSVVIKKRHF